MPKGRSGKSNPPSSRITYFAPAFTEACLKWKVKSLRERDAIPAAEAIELRDWLFSPEAAHLAQMPAEEEEFMRITKDKAVPSKLQLRIGTDSSMVIHLRKSRPAGNLIMNTLTECMGDGADGQGENCTGQICDLSHEDPSHM